MLRVPLIVRAPALRPTRIEELVRLTDVMPTVLDMLDVPSPPVDGVSLAALMRGTTHDLNLEAYSESLYPQRMGWSPLRALRDGKFKLIDAPRPELHDVQDDPGEETNIYDTRRALAEKMTARLAALARGRDSASTPRQGVSPEMRAQLTSLGYLGGAARHEPTGRTALPDPKDCIGSYTRERGSTPVLPSCGPWRPADEGDGAPPAPHQR